MIILIDRPIILNYYPFDRGEVFFVLGRDGVSA
jgi:hypothetical protein